MATISLESVCGLSWGFQVVMSPPHFQPDGNNHEKFLYSDSPPYADLLQYNYTGKHA